MAPPNALSVIVYDSGILASKLRARIEELSHTMMEGK